MSAGAAANAVLMNLQLSAPKRVKQEDGEEVLPGDDAASARPPTSFLDLPDDILLPILEEFYEQRYDTITPAAPLRIAEIRVNKRIFLLARPLWHKLLFIAEPQLDLRLSGLLEDKARQTSIRHLEVALTNSHANLIKTVISLLPCLTTLAFFLSDSLVLDTVTPLLERLGTIDSVKHLLLWSSKNLRNLTKFYSNFVSSRPRIHPRVEFEVEGKRMYVVETGGNAQRMMLRYSRKHEMKFAESNWTRVQSLDLRGREGLAIPSARLLETLREALVGSDDVPTANQTKQIPLRRLAMDLHFLEIKPGGVGFFTIPDFKAFFNLLAHTNIAQLELRDLESIPPFDTGYLLPSLKLLRLSGSVNLTYPAVFLPLLATLNCFPSLLQLHLEGDFFAAGSTPADLMSKHETMPLYFHYPYLCTLLTYLRQSQVLIFTYRGSKEGREMRWTRLTAGDEFDRDCWTLCLWRRESID